MEEFINKLDNLAVFQIFGGVGMVIAAIAVLISKLINQRLISRWKLSNSTILADINGKISRNNDLVSNLVQQHGANFQTLLDHRIKASNLYWQKILEIKSKIPSSVRLVYQVFLKEEITVENLNKSKLSLGE